nr:radical SAM protein [Desulfobacteraceae bacterium]
MECTQPSLLDPDAFYLDFVRKVRQQRIPVNGSIELTRQCNFNCIHCYLGDMRTSSDILRNELNTSQWIKIIDEIVEAGCLFLLFTGGEPLLRKDFIDIYRHAVKRGMLVTVFTNGSLISNEILDVFKEFPPQVVEVSLYGSTAETYKSITGRIDGFKKTMAGIEKLSNHGIRTQLKTILMTKNQHEFDLIQKISDDRGLKFRFDAMIFPRLNGERSPVEYRVSPEIIVEKDLSSPDRRSKWEEFYRRMKNIELSDVLYDCGAGVTNFHIDSVGMLSPCIMTGHVSYDLLHGLFSDGWENKIPKIKEKKVPLEFACRKCKNQSLCGYCPAFFKLETGSD